MVEIIWDDYVEWGSGRQWAAGLARQGSIMVERRDKTWSRLLLSVMGIINILLLRMMKAPLNIFLH